MSLDPLFRWVALILNLILSSTAIFAGSQSRPVILISVDTLRADRLGCYGYRGQTTPHADAIAQGGTLFSQVSSQVPLTLPSHVSLLTSTYPFFNGVQDNGQQLAPGAITLASVLKSRGYRTGAFVGSYVLDRRFGLSQGFDFYDSPFDLHRRSGSDAADAKRLGEEVVGSAIRWIETNSNEAFFAFLHLYDLHKPYDLPASWRKPLGTTEGYEAQLSYEDEVLGNLWSFLTKRGLLEKSLIVFTSDHGEGLGDHGESTHGYFIYQSTLRVPLIIHWPAGSEMFSAKIDDPVSLLDVAPTILQFLSIPLPSDFQGRSLLALARDKGSPTNAEIYSESFFARNHFGCATIRSLRQGRFKYIDAPKPELYDLTKDPAEAHNIYIHDKSLALALRERISALCSHFGARKPAPKMVSEEAEAALRSLGYLSITSLGLNVPDSRTDPKDRLREAESYHLAVALASSGKLEESNALLGRLRTKLPDVTAISISLGLNQQKLGRHAEAAKAFRAALKLDPSDIEAHYGLAVSLLVLNEIDQAINELQVALKIAPEHSRTYYLLGSIWMQRKDHDRARECFSRMLVIAPEDYAAHYQLGTLETLEGRWQEGQQHLLAALKTDPDSPEANNALGSVYFRRGNLNGAHEAFSKAISLEPKFAWAHYNLGLVLQQQKENGQAAQQFRQALVADPQFQQARQALSAIDQSSK